jgi:hypothetical protein
MREMIRGDLGRRKGDFDGTVEEFPEEEEVTSLRFINLPDAAVRKSDVRNRSAHKQIFIQRGVQLSKRKPPSRNFFWASSWEAKTKAKVKKTQKAKIQYPKQRGCE